MKTAILWLMTLVVLLVPAARVLAWPEMDIKTAAIYYVPYDEDTFERGVGVDLQVQFWGSTIYGVALAAGFGQWDVAEEKRSYPAIGLYSKIEGSATMTPLGASLLVRLRNQDKLAVMLEAGIRYVMVDIDAQMGFSISEDGPIGAYAKYEADDVVLALLQIDLDYRVLGPISVLVGAGYQFDIKQGAVYTRVYGVPLESESRLLAHHIKVGARIRF